MDKELTKTVDLSVRNRLILPSLLPEKGNYITMLVLKDLRNKLIFSREERAKLQIREVPGGGLQWEPEAEFTSTLKFHEDELAIIKKALNDLNEKNELNFELIELYEMFCTSTAKLEGQKPALTLVEPPPPPSKNPADAV